MEMTYHTPLSASVQSALGITPPAPLAMADQVRFSELDVLQHVNNAVYLSWFERVRVRYLQLNGGTPVNGAGLRVVLRSGTIHYIKEMRLDEKYVVTCGCTAYRNTSFTMRQTLWVAGELRAQFDCVLVLLNPDGSGRFPIPEALKQKFRDVDGAVFEG